MTTILSIAALSTFTIALAIASRWLTDSRNWRDYVHAAGGELQAKQHTVALRAARELEEQLAKQKAEDDAAVDRVMKLGIEELQRTGYFAHLAREATNVLPFPRLVDRVACGRPINVMDDGEGA